MRHDLILLLALPLFVLSVRVAWAQADRPGGGPAGPAAEIAQAAKAWVESLNDGQREVAQFAFDAEERFDWHYVPRRRDGLAVKDMSGPQQDAARRLIRATLSQQGAVKVEAIMALESVLAEIESGRSSFRDPENFAFTLFGEAGSPPWGWRVEGHHLSVNVAVAPDGTITITPTFTGTNPARIPSGPREGERIQKDEYFLALELAQSLDAAQREAAVLQERSLGNIVTGPGRGDALKAPQGVPVSDLTEDQRALLMRLVETYVGLARDEVGARYMDLIREGLDETRFA